VSTIMMRNEQILAQGERKDHTSFLLRLHCRPGMFAANKNNPSQIPWHPCIYDQLVQHRTSPLEVHQKFRALIEKSKHCIPGSSGNMSRSHGMVGSTKGRGVFSSKNNGRLMATFEPRLVLMLAVKVLKSNSARCTMAESID
jgi:hypothetical protein